MKKSLLILFLFVGLGATAQHSNLHWETDMLKAVDRSIAEKKPMMLFFTGSDWCGWCIRLQKEVFFLPEFEKWANENVVLMELDYPRKKVVPQPLRDQNNQMQQMFGVRGYPTVWFVNPSKTDQNVNFERIGSTGYVRGGPAAWIGKADAILSQAKN